MKALRARELSCLHLLLPLALAHLTCAAEFAGGTGEPNDPYQIATFAQLVSVGTDQNLLDRHFVVVSDINLDPNLPGRCVFQAALIAPEFSGSFDGQGHVIKNLTMHDDTGASLGLFASIGRAGRVRHLHLENARVTGADVIGVLARANYGTIEDCTAAGVILGLEQSELRIVGGLVAANEEKGVISRCHAAVDIRTEGRGTRVGGLAGLNFGIVTGCGATGAISCADYGFDVGGLVGANGHISDSFFPHEVQGTVAGCRATGDVSGGLGANGVGGLVGWHYCGTISDCYSTGGVSGANESACLGGLLGGSDSYAKTAVVKCYASGKVAAGEQSEELGGLIGAVDSGKEVNDCFWDVETSGMQTSTGGTGLPTAQMQTGTTFTAGGWDFDKIWTICERKDYPRLQWERADRGQFAGGSGEPNDPYQIATAGQLLSIGSDPNLLNKHFRLICDIDLDPNLPGGRVLMQAVIAPVGDFPGYYRASESGGFGGSFDGHEHIIRNLTLREATRGYPGLFGYIASTGRVRGVRLEDACIIGLGWAGILVCHNKGMIEDCNATGTVVGTWKVGGLVGCNGQEGTIARCHATADVRAEIPDRAIGGLAGENLGVITDCGAAGTVSCGEFHWGDVGALVGNNGYVADDEFFVANGTITRSCATGKVTCGPGAGGVGGLVGWNYCGTIVDCYATGDVSAGRDSWALAGLVGGGYFYAGEWFGDSAIIRCYSGGTVTAGEESDGFGGLLGFTEWGGEVTASFWDMEASGMQVSERGKGLPTAQMQTATTFTDAGWDFEKVWTICEGMDYPRLRWEQVSCK